MTYFEFQAIYEEMCADYQAKLDALITERDRMLRALSERFRHGERRRDAPLTGKYAKYMKGGDVT